LLHYDGMAPNWWSELRGNVPRKWAILLGLVPVLLLLAFWWFLTRGASEDRIISVTILPSPAEVLTRTVDFAQQTDRETSENLLMRHILLSLRRVALAYLCALAVVFPLGVLMGSFGSVRATFQPIATASSYVPLATLVPLTMAWFGTDELQKVFFLALAFGIYLLPLVIQAIDAVPDVYLRTAYTLGASRTQVVCRVLIPVAMPEIWQAMRLAFGVGWTYLVLAEVIVRAGGLGDLFEHAKRYGKREDIYLVVVLITLIAWCSDLLWDRLGRLLFPYRRRAS
jgi:NitT/TauT family transport system permease protein